MTIKVGTRPAQLDGCWKTWAEQDIDNVVRTEMDAGNLKTRRRFTGRARVVKATVTLPAALYSAFTDWWLINQAQGSKATRVKTPYGTEEVFLWTRPPAIAWPSATAFTATVDMYRGAAYP